ncbi:hypothetical protein BGX28_005794 [Mortierella sp. GBA30]|nr:hypothetical protein BGX28_005794 [Mortierella sp. GBA30]
MLRPKSSCSSQKSSPSPSPIPGSRSSSSASNHHPHQQHDSTSTGVRRAFSTLQHALSPSRTSLSSDRKATTTSEQLHHTSNANSNGTVTQNGSILSGSTFSTNSNATVESLYHSTSNMTFLTSNDGNSYHNDGNALQSQRLDTNGFLVNSVNAVIPVQLRVRHLERGAAYSGYLTKFSSRTFFSRKQWKRRYFILNKRSLHCFKSSDPQHPLLESLTLCADTIICVTDIFSGKRYCLQITSPGEKNWYVLADTAAEMSGWLRELKSTVLRFRNPQPDSRPGTHCSDSSEMSDLSASSAAMTDVTPSVPSIPSQYDLFLTASRSPSPPAHPSHPSQRLDFYHPSMTGGLNPIPRAVTPKSANSQESRRRKNSSISSALPADYVSFGTVMERADAVSPEGEKVMSFALLPSASAPRYQGDSAHSDRRDDHGSGVNSDRMSAASNGLKNDNDNTSNTRSTSSVNRNDSSGGTSKSSGSTSESGRRLSVVVDRPETMITLPRRSSQRLMGSPSRPMSPVSSRPLSPSVNRASPRSSLVVSPPPRSIHRPSHSLSSRHSAQVSSFQMPSEMHSPSGSIRSLSPTQDLTRDGYHGSLSKITSMRQLRENTMSDRPCNSAGTPSGPRRSSSRVSVLSDRPLSPTPSLSTAPTSPLPEPPTGSPPSTHNQTLKHSFTNGSSHRISIVPRHHDPDLYIPRRSSSKPRSRTKSQDGALVSMLSEVNLTARSSTPSPRLSATTTYMDGIEAAQGSVVTPPLSPLGPCTLPEGALTNFPLDSHGRLILPPPPTGQRPEPPAGTISTGTASIATVSNSSPRTGSRSSSNHRNMHRHSPSTSSLCSLSSSTSSIASFATGSAAAVGPAFGGGVARKHSSRDSAALAARLSTLVPIPLGAAASVPSPPQKALPPIPMMTPPHSGPHSQSRPSSVQSISVAEDLPTEGRTEVTMSSLESERVAQNVIINSEVDSEASSSIEVPVLAGFEMILEEEEETECESETGDKDREEDGADMQVKELKVSDAFLSAVPEAPVELKQVKESEDKVPMKSKASALKSGVDDLQEDGIILLSGQDGALDFETKVSELAAPCSVPLQSSAIA